MTLLDAYLLVACAFALCLRDFGPGGRLVPTRWTFLWAAAWPALALMLLFYAILGRFEGMWDEAMEDEE